MRLVSLVKRSASRTRRSLPSHILHDSSPAYLAAFSSSIFPFTSSWSAPKLTYFIQSGRGRASSDWRMARLFTIIIGLSCLLFEPSQESSCDEEVEKKEFKANRDRFGLFLKELQTVLRPDQINTDDDDCKDRGKPWNSYHKIDSVPQVIVQPESTEDVSAILKLCTKFNVPVVPFGGGTSLEGQTMAYCGGVSLDMNNMAQVLEVNEHDLDCTVEAGIGYQELNRLLKDKYKVPLWFPLDPGPGASIGGMCACRCSGSTAVRYGSMRDNVLNVTAVLPDGQVIKTGSRARKCSAGYDLTRLLIGSEGTLAVITEVTLKLHGIPQHTSALRVHFKNITDAAATARDTLNCGVVIGRCELMDKALVKIINSSNCKDDQPQNQWDEAHTLMYEVTGPSLEAVQDQLAIVERIATENNGFGVKVAFTSDECTALWKARKEALWSIMGAYPDREPMITDVCVPLSRLPDLIGIIREEIEKTNIPCPICAHAGDGNLHVIVMMDTSNPTEVLEAKNFVKFMGLTAIEMGGTCTGEHGVGIGKMDLLENEMGLGSIETMKRIKRELDPRNIMNPGKVLHMDTSKKSPHSSTIYAKANYRLCS